MDYSTGLAVNIEAWFCGLLARNPHVMKNAAWMLGSFASFQKPCIPDSRSLGNDQFKAKLLRPFGQRSDLLLAIPGFVVFGPSINVGVSVFDEPVEQAG
jgi:hypothetical protein